MIEAEWRQADQVLRAIMGTAELLDDVPWLKRSISARNGYVDPLNMIQVELQFRARKNDATEAADLAHLRQLAVKGIAAGMRTTG
jgi:phosphoenolpyruvate carboxylase